MTDPNDDRNVRRSPPWRIIGWSIPILLLLLPLRAFAQAPPRLVVFITVDQLKGDYFERFDSELTGGFRIRVLGVY